MNLCKFCIQHRFSSRSKSILCNQNYMAPSLFLHNAFLTNNAPQLSQDRESRSRSTASHSTISRKQKQKNVNIAKNAPDSFSSDYIGPPDPVSNMPHMQFYRPKDETQTEKEFRLLRMEVLDWNHKFWSLHNEKFFKEKEAYVEKNGIAQTGSKKKTLSPEEMSVFYRNFLNENRTIHANYNKEWYKKNFKLLWPAVKVAFIQLRKKAWRERPKESK